MTDPEFIAEEERLMEQYTQGCMSVHEYIAFQVKPLADMDVADIDHLTEGFVAEVIVPKIYPQAKVLLQELRSAGHRLVIVSATAAFIVRAVAKQLGWTMYWRLNWRRKTTVTPVKSTGCQPIRRARLPG